jgi:hypothetical protein
VDACVPIIELKEKIGIEATHSATTQSIVWLCQKIQFEAQMSSKTLVYPVWNIHIIQNWDLWHQNHLARIELDANHWDIL